MKKKINTIIVSDWHLGPSIAQTKRINKFLDKIIEGKISTKKFILDGDILDLNWGKLEEILEDNQEILKKLVKIDQLGVNVIYVLGNHDPLTKKQAGVVHKYLDKLGNNQIEIHHGYQLKFNGFVYLVTHGHTFDFFNKEHPRLSNFLDLPDRLLIHFDNLFKIGLSQLVKYFIRQFYDYSKLVEHRCRKYLAKKIFHGIIIGHTHIPKITSWKVKTKVNVKLSKKLRLYLKTHKMPAQIRTKYYLNSGDWVESAHCTYIILRENGERELHYFRDK